MSKPRHEPFKTPPRIDPGPNHYWVQNWELSDEFERSLTDSWLRRQRWETINPTWKGRAPSFFKKDNVIVQNGSMKLRSREDNPPANFPSMYKDFSTAFVRTRKRSLYGYFEIYCRMMDSKISSAFWFAYNTPDQWTELDVFEYSTSDKPTAFGKPYKQLFNTNMHVHRNPKGVKMSSPQVYDAGFDLSAQPVKVGFNWQEDKIQWYLNDKLVREEKNEYFHQPLHLQLDSEAFPKWFGLPETGGCHKNSLPNAFEIFYVRSWNRSVHRSRTCSKLSHLKKLSN